jgi:hypothetical protein
MSKSKGRKAAVATKPVASFKPLKLSTLPAVAEQFDARGFKGKRTK